MAVAARIVRGNRVAMWQSISRKRAENNGSQQQCNVDLKKKPHRLKL
jgi:hypothetical protein